MMNLFFQDCENASWCTVTWSACADIRSCDADTVAIDVRHLLGNAGYDKQRPFRRTFGFPNVLAGFQCDRFRRYADALGKGFGRNDATCQNKYVDCCGEKR